MAVIGVDVGTGSARAGVFDDEGVMLGRAVHPIRLDRPRDGYAQHGSSDIWRAVCAAVRGAVREAGVDPAAISGLAFDAACSLVLRDANGAPVSIDPEGRHGDDGLVWDTIVWMDHRASAEAERATATAAAPLAFIGGVMSPEMQTPKLAWIKRNLPQAWAAIAHAFDLADFLSWAATGSTARSACTLTCKWTYLAGSTPHWDEAYLAAMDLSDLRERAGLPERATPIGQRVGRLSARAARDLGLAETSCAVGAGLIDAHAGALGTLAPFLGPQIDRHMALIAGTSNCHMALSPRPIPIRGVWGPYADAVVAGTFLAEGGQSAAGALLDHLIENSSAGPRLGGNPHDAIAEILSERLAASPDLAPELHLLPDFHGNRSPTADPKAKGAITGLTLAEPLEQLLNLYWAAAAAIAYETREIVIAMNAAGYRIERAHLSGGAIRNPVLCNLYAQACGLEASLPASEDPVLLGSAVVAARAAGLYPDLATAARAMVREPTPIARDPAAVAVHDRRFERYRAFADFQRGFHKDRPSVTACRP